MCVMAHWHMLPLEKWKRNPRTYDASKPAMTPEGFRAAFLARRAYEAEQGLAAAAEARQQALASAHALEPSSNGALHDHEDADGAQAMDVEGGGDSEGTAGAPHPETSSGPGVAGAEGSAERGDAAPLHVASLDARAEPAEASEVCAGSARAMPGEERSSGGAGDGALRLQLQEKVRRLCGPWGSAALGRFSHVVGAFELCAPRRPRYPESA